MSSDLHERILTGQYESELREISRQHKLPPHSTTYTTDWQLAWRYRRKWLALYEGCAIFRDALGEFYRDYYVPAAPHVAGWHPNGFEQLGYQRALRSDIPTEIARYRDGMQEFCWRWGLDRLYPVEIAARTARTRSAEERVTIFADSRPDGFEEVHAWCYNRAVRPEIPFDAVRGAGGALPSLGESRWIRLSEEVTLVDATGDPAVTVEVTEPWRFGIEDWHAVERRVLEQVKEQLRIGRDRVLKRARDEGAIYQKAQPALLRDLAWAFMHVALDLTYPQILQRTPPEEREGRTEQNIADAVSDRAPLFGLRLAR